MIMTTLLGVTSADVPRFPDAPVRWTALRYELPADDAATRAYLWRQMRARAGVNVHRGLWAVSHGADGCPDLAGVAERLRSVGAGVDLVDVDRDDELNDALRAACDRLWAGFFAAADRLRERMPGAHGAARSGSAGLVDDLPGLRDRFGRTLAADLVHGAVVARAADVLDDLEWIDRNVGRPTAPVGDGPVRPSLEAASTVGLHGGGVRVVAHLCPAPGWRWERDLAEFEAATYRADRNRATLRHGTLVASGGADDVVRTLTRVTDRISRFNVIQI
jgi:hypothetical protein